MTAAFQEASRHGFEHAKFPRGFHDNHVADLSETAWDGPGSPWPQESLPSPSQATRLSPSMMRVRASIRFRNNHAINVGTLEAACQRIHQVGAF